MEIGPENGNRKWKNCFTEVTKCKRKEEISSSNERNEKERNGKWKEKNLGLYEVKRSGNGKRDREEKKD